MSGGVSLERQLAQLQQGDHVGVIFDDSAALWSVVAQFLKHGLDHDERCLCIVDNGAQDEARAALIQADGALELALQRGAVILHTKDESLRRSGKFESHDAIDFIEQHLHGALAAGCTGLRVSCDMTCLLGKNGTGGGDLARLVPFALLLNQYIARRPLLAISHFDQRLFPPRVIHDVLRTHPRILVDNQITENIFHEPASLVLGAGIDPTRVKWMIDQIRRVRLADQALRGQRARGRGADQSADLAARHGVEESRRIIDALPAAAYTCNADGLITYYNSRAVDVWGREPKLNDPADRFCGSFKLFSAAGEPLRHDQCWMALALQNDRTYDAQEILIERPDGGRATVLAHARPQHDESGKVIGALNVLIDITQRKRDEESLRAGEENLRAMFGSSVIGIGILTPQGRFVQVNDTFAAIIGFEKEELVGLDITSITHAEHAAEMNRLLDELRTGKRSHFVLEQRYRRKGGQLVWVQDSVSISRDKDGVAMNLIVMCQDISERKRATQAAFEATRRAEAANNAKDRFLAVLSHELRTPLTPVMMSLSTMETDPHLPQHLRDDLAMVRRNLELETKLIDDLLDLSRISRGTLRLQLQPTGVHGLLHHILASCRHDLTRKRLAIEMRMNAPHDQVNADSARLQQVLWNVIRNAIKFTPDGGRIIVSTTNPRPQRLRIEISDTGVGISREKLPQIFNAFDQFESKSAGPEGALGLGLTISSALIEMLGGTIHAASDGENHGANIVIELAAITHADSSTQQGAAPPRSSSEEVRQRAKSGAPDEVERDKRVLLVEDHADSAKTLARLLRQCGFVVSIAGSVSAALALVEANAFDLVISDIGLPDATGYELMRTIRSRQNIKGIALSGYGMEEDMRKSRAAGFADHLIKPINVGMLTAAIEKLFEESPLA